MPPLPDPCDEPIADPPPEPPRPEALRSKLLDDGSTMIVEVREGSIVLAVFLGVWLTFWTIGCVALIQKCIAGPTFESILFGVPFWASWIAVSFAVLASLFSRSRLAFSDWGLQYESSILRPVWQANVPLHELRSARVLEELDGDGDRTSSIQVLTTGRHVLFGPSLPEREKEWLAFRFNEFIRLRQQVLEIKPLTSGGQADCRNVPALRDSTWRRIDAATQDFSRLGEPDSVVLEHCGRWNVSTILGLLFLNSFWNGITASITWQALRGNVPVDDAFPVPLWLFLLPFQLVGCGMLLALLAAVVAPWTTTRWTFRPGAIRVTSTVLGFCWSDVQQPIRGEILHGAVRDDLKRPRRFGFPDRSRSDNRDGTSWGLLLTNDQSHEVCSLSGLTLAEAMWLKGVLQTQGLMD